MDDKDPNVTAPEGESLERPDPPGGTLNDDSISSVPVSDKSIRESQAFTSPYAPPENQPAIKPPGQRRFRFIPGRTFLTAGIFLVAVALLVGGAWILWPRPQPDNTVVINTQSLDNGTLNKLTPQNGKPLTQLTITADVLASKDLKVQGSATIQDDLGVGGNLTVNGTTTLGTTSLQDTTVNNSLALRGTLSVTGNSTLNGNLAVSGSLSVAGALTAGALSTGSVTASSLTLSNNLTVGGHLIPIGSTPSVSPGPAARGGTVSVTGNDIAGTITINTGGAGALTGTMATVSFRTPFALTPKVQLTPVNIDAADVRYYAARSTTFFTVNSTTNIANSTTYVFDYLVTQ